MEMIKGDVLGGRTCHHERHWRTSLGSLVLDDQSVKIKTLATKSFDYVVRRIHHESRAVLAQYLNAHA
jgi:hypothetical protein